MELSYLHYEKYKKCPLQYKWSFVERPSVWIDVNLKNAFIGFLLQKLVEWFYLKKYWQSPDGVITQMQKELPLASQLILDSHPIKLSDPEIIEWQKVAQDAIPLIVKIIKEEKLLSTEVYVEREEEVPLDSDKLQMKTDFLIIRNEVITLLDGKGGKTVGRYIDKDQLYFYSLACRQVWKRLPHRLGFWWFRHGKIQWLPISNEEVDRVLAQARAYINGIKSGKFDATPSQHCRLCDFRICCPTGQKFISERVTNPEVEIPDNCGEVSF